MNNFSCAKTSFVPPEPRGETEERYILRDVIYWLNFPRRRTSKRGRKSSRHKSERKYFFIIRRSLEAGAYEADSNQGWSQHRPLRCLTSVWWPNEKKKMLSSKLQDKFFFLPWSLSWAGIRHDLHIVERVSERERTSPPPPSQIGIRQRYT